MTGLRIKDGYMFATGVVLLFLVFRGIGWVADRLYPSGFDDSDAPPYRSGLTIKTDNLNGCQYLTTWSGQIVPRMGRDRKQICRDADVAGK